MGNVQIVSAKQLDEKGRCCGRKPLVYRRPHHRFFCHRCHAEFDPETGKQIPNWAYYRLDNDRFEARTSAAHPSTNSSRQDG